MLRHRPKHTRRAFVTQRNYSNLSVGRFINFILWCNIWRRHCSIHRSEHYFLPYTFWLSILSKGNSAWKTNACSIYSLLLWIVPVFMAMAISNILPVFWTHYSGKQTFLTNTGKLVTTERRNFGLLAVNSPTSCNSQCTFTIKAAVETGPSSCWGSLESTCPGGKSVHTVLSQFDRSSRQVCYLIELTGPLLLLQIGLYVHRNHKAY